MGAIVNGAEPALLARLRRRPSSSSRLHEGGDPARRAHGHARRSSSSPTTRSAWARTARPTSPSSSSRTCARCRNLNVVRPAGANETALAWQLRDRRQPARRPRSRSRARGCRCGTRPACPTTRSSAAPTCCASPTRSPTARPDPDGHRARRCTSARARPTCSRPTGSPRASCPCPAWTRFAEQDAALPATASCRPTCRARVSVEAAATLGWERWVGDAGEAIGMTDVRRLGPGQGALRALRLHAGERSPSGGTQGRRRRSEVATTTGRSPA